MMVFATQKTNRLLYVLDFMFAQFSNVSYQLTQTEEAFINYAGPKINYSEKPLCNDEIYIQPSGFLTGKTVHFFIPYVDNSSGTPVLFPLSKNAENALHFDIFSAIFYVLSRYEEYSEKAKDQYGRFPAKESLAHKHHFLHLPIVDIWLTEFFNRLIFYQSLFTSHSSLFATHKKTTIHFTYDIDVAYAYKGREAARQAGAALKDIIRINPYNLAQRTAVLSGYLEDPFDTYDYIRKESINPIVFFLLSEQKTKYDRNINPKKKALKNLIKEVEKWCPAGIHPSFYSSVKEDKLTAEINILASVIHQPVIKSRQHYLKFTMPQTYRSLLRNGIKEDYSMAFAETPGFRAGTCTPFYFFDVEKDETTGLKLYPACIMDSTFRDDMVMPAEEALPFFIQYFNAVNNVNGHFISIWHNDTLAANNKQHFRWLHQQILQYIRKQLKLSAISYQQ